MNAPSALLPAAESEIPYAIGGAAHCAATDLPQVTPRGLEILHVVNQLFDALAEHVHELSRNDGP